MRIEKKMFESKLKRTPKPGVRVELISMDDVYSNLKEGDRGTITKVSPNGDIQVNWDNGSRLSLLPGEDSFILLHEETFGVFNSDKRDPRVGRTNNYYYQQADLELSEEDVDAGMTKTNQSTDQTEDEEDPFEGKERRFRASIYVDVHVPMTEDLNADKQYAKQVASELLKKMNHKDISNVYLGGIAYNPYDESEVNFDEFEKL